MRALLTFCILAFFLPVSSLLREEATSSAQTPAAPARLSQDDFRALIREAADKDLENDRKQRDYIYIQREEEHRLDGKGKVKSTEARTYEIMVLYEEPVRKLIAKDDQPLSGNDAVKEDQKIQKIIDKRRHETEEDHRKRLEKQERDREEGRRFVKEIADAYDFSYGGEEKLDGRGAWVIDAEPRAGYEPHTRGAKFLPKFRFRAWVDQAEKQWVKLDVQCIDTVSVGLFLVRVHQGSNIQIEQLHINDEVWLPRHIALKLDARLALFKGINLEEDVTYRDYRKFRSDTRILPAGEAAEPH